MPYFFIKAAVTLLTLAYGIVATARDFHRAHEGRTMLTTGGYLGITMLVVVSLIGFGTDACKATNDREAEAERKMQASQQQETLNTSLRLVNTISEKVTTAANTLQSTAETTEELLTETERLVYAVGELGASFVISIPIDHDVLKAYRDRLDAGLAALPAAALNDKKIAKRGQYGWASELPLDSPLLPRPDESLAYQLVHGFVVRMEFTKKDGGVIPDLLLRYRSGIYGEAKDAKKYAVEYVARHEGVPGRMELSAWDLEPETLHTTTRLRARQDFDQAKLRVMLVHAPRTGDRAYERGFDSLQPDMALRVLGLFPAVGNPVHLESPNFTRSTVLHSTVFTTTLRNWKVPGKKRDPKVAAPAMPTK